MDYRIEHVSLEKLRVQKSNFRVNDVESGIEDLASSIRANGLLQPAVAYRKNNGYVILAGQRRLLAYHLLNEMHPGKFEKMPCIIMDEPESDEKKMSLCLAENITQLPMAGPDLRRAATNLYGACGNYGTAESEYGLVPHMIRRHVRLSRLSEGLQDAVRDGKIHPNPVRAEHAALEAADALDYVEHGPVPEQTVLDLASEMAKDGQDMRDLAIEAKRGGGIEEIKKLAKGRPKSALQIRLDTEISEKLREVAESDGQPSHLKAARYVADGVERDYGLL